MKMIELSRKIEPKDIIAALAGVSIPLDDILNRKKVNPTEVVRIVQVMEGVLALRTLLKVQSGEQDAQLERMAAELLELATGVIQRAQGLILRSSTVGMEVGDLLDQYADAVDAALVVISKANRELEPQFRLALRWTS